jgi:hypothetical protein
MGSSLSGPPATDDARPRKRFRPPGQAVETHTSRPLEQRPPRLREHHHGVIRAQRGGRRLFVSRDQSIRCGPASAILAQGEARSPRDKPFRIHSQQVASGEHIIGPVLNVLHSRRDDDIDV